MDRAEIASAVSLLAAAQTRGVFRYSRRELRPDDTWLFEGSLCHSLDTLVVAHAAGIFTVIADERLQAIAQLRRSGPQALLPITSSALPERRSSAIW